MSADHAEQQTGEIVTSNYFSSLGVKPLLGRFFSPATNDFSCPSDQIVLSYGFWRSRLGGSSQILGRSVTVNGRPFTVIGITEPGFQGTNLLVRDDLWLPLSAYREVSMVPELIDQRGGQAFQLIGRLNRGVSREMAVAELSAIMRRLEQAFPDDNRGQSIAVLPLGRAAISPDKRQAYLSTSLLSSLASGVLLLLTVIHVGHLLLARTMARTRESFIRIMLGAPKSSLVLHLSAEGAVMAFAGGGLGVLFAIWTENLLWHFRPPFFDASSVDVHMRGRTFLTAFVIAAVIALAFAVIFGLRIFRSESLRQLEFSMFDGQSVKKRRSFDWLVVFQIGLCTVALGAGALLLRNLWQAQQVDLGFKRRGLVNLTTDLQSAGIKQQEWLTVTQALADRLRMMPGIEAVAVAENRLLGGFRLWRRIARADHPVVVSDRPLIGAMTVGTGYFRAVGIPLHAGREFSGHDEHCRCVVVNQELARKLWGQDEALEKGLLVDVDSSPYQVIGMVGNIKLRAVDDAPHGFLYLNDAEQPSSLCCIRIEDSKGRGELQPIEVKKVIRQVHAELPIIDFEKFEATVDRSLWMPRFLAILFLQCWGFSLCW